MRDVMAWAYYMDTDLFDHDHVQVYAKRTDKQPGSIPHAEVPSHRQTHADRGDAARVCFVGIKHASTPATAITHCG